MIAKLEKHKLQEINSKQCSMNARLEKQDQILRQLMKIIKNAHLASNFHFLNN